MFAIKAPVVKVVAAAQNQKSEKKAMCVFASTRSTLDFEFRFFIIFVPRKRERERRERASFITGIGSEKLFEHKKKRKTRREKRKF